MYVVFGKAKKMWKGMEGYERTLKGMEMHRRVWKTALGDLV